MDALKAARALEAGGLDKKQAEAIARVLHDAGRAGSLREPVLKTTLRQHAAVVILANAAVMTLLFKFLG